MITAPYNFVPLSDKVFTPSWGKDISHDIPFEDGLSGSIKLKIIAESPLFVRNGHTKDDAEKKSDDYKSFSNIRGQYFIPSTSLKGIFRTAIEILSFGKMSHIDNKRYSIRDLKLKNYTNYFQNASSSDYEIHCGWMSVSNGTITITDNGIPRRVSHYEIDNEYNTEFCNIFSNKDNLKSSKNRSCIYKYTLMKGCNLHNKFTELPLNSKNKVDTRKKVKIDKKGTLSGTIVLTGQPSYRFNGGNGKKPSGKFYEFVFPDEIYKNYIFDEDEENGIYADFKFIYKDSDEWKYWKSIMQQGGNIPVFFSMKNGELIHLGLSYLYKLPAKKRIKEFLPDIHKSNKLDMAECMFGISNGQDSLKGRIMISNAFLTDGNSFAYEIAPYMGSPKPSYYPNYFVQKGTNGIMQDKNGRGVYFKTLLEDDANLRGWKKYPVSNGYQTRFEIPRGQEQNTNPFIPVASGSIFETIIRFHNIKPEELGALIYAIELKEGCSHSIGLAKPFGYGRCKMEITSATGFELSDKNKYKDKFENLMCDNIDNYKKSPQLKEFFAMSRPQDLNTKLEYMELPEFAKYKNQHFKEDKNQTFGEYLENYTYYIKKTEVSNSPKKEVGKAIVRLLNPFKKAALIEGKHADLSVPLIVERQKIKVGDKILVEIVYKGGNVDKLIFKEKI